MAYKAAKKFTLSLGALVASAFLATACGDNSQDSQTSIYGGKATATGEFNTAIAITNRYSGVFCSGTLITPTVAITAAHCIPAMGNPADNYIYVGSGKENGLYLGQFQVASAKASPSYNQWGGSSGQNDIAYITLKQAVPLPKEAFIPVLTKKSEFAEIYQVNKTVRVIGFGGRDNGGMGVKYQVDAPIKSGNGNEIMIGGNGKDSCQGDSGGPAFGQLANGEWRVFGVVSRGGRCGTGGYYGRMDANICWVQKDSGQDLGLPEGTCSGTSAGVSASRPE